MRVLPVHNKSNSRRPDRERVIGKEPIGALGREMAPWNNAGCPLVALEEDGASGKPDSWWI